MSKNKGPWDDGRRAWERLNGWHQDAPSATPGHADDGNAALAALADVGTVRHLLDQAELVGVRTARRHGKSWAEIATKLGVARQSAWERWRDLDSTERWRDLDTPALEEAPSATPTSFAPTSAHCGGRVPTRSDLRAGSPRPAQAIYHEGAERDRHDM